MGWVLLVVGRSGSFGYTAKVMNTVIAPIPIAVFRAEDLFMTNDVIGVNIELALRAAIVIVKAVILFLVGVYLC
jgi:hypothetical protein